MINLNWTQTLPEFLVYVASNFKTANIAFHLFWTGLKAVLESFKIVNTTATECRGTLAICRSPNKVSRTQSSPEHGPWSNKKSLKWSLHAKHWAQNNYVWHIKVHAKLFVSVFECRICLLSQQWTCDWAVHECETQLTHIHYFSFLFKLKSVNK